MHKRLSDMIKMMSKKKKDDEEIDSESPDYAQEQLDEGAEELASDDSEEGKEDMTAADMAEDEEYDEETPTKKRGLFKRNGGKGLHVLIQMGHARKG